MCHKNSSLINTALRRSNLLQHDTTSPRPYSRLNTLYGTRGVFAGFPDRIALGDEEWTTDFKDYRARYEHPLWKKVGEIAKKAGGHGGMDYVMCWRLIDCLKRGLPLDMSVYDGMSWSCIVELSCKSVANRSAPMDFPDFTRGAWKTTAPMQVTE
jgi:hypothetical protein